mmetsp:Transcript_111546/g.193563  ORF Transcript_111546/g.193563 Transcript_111546/m.193563 type:complete len:201 (+) Transcript_111546:57-659(+)
MWTRLQQCKRILRARQTSQWSPPRLPPPQSTRGQKRLRLRASPSSSGWRPTRSSPSTATPLRPAQLHRHCLIPPLCWSPAPNLRRLPLTKIQTARSPPLRPLQGKQMSHPRKTGNRKLMPQRMSGQRLRSFERTRTMVPPRRRSGRGARSTRASPSRRPWQACLLPVNGGSTRTKFHRGRPASPSMPPSPLCCPVALAST